MIDTIYIELTNNCNCVCNSCPQSLYPCHLYNRPKGFMDFNLFKDIIDQTWTVTNKINFSFFGESTLHSQFLDCMEYLKLRPRNKQIILFSNFLAVTKEIMGSFIDIKLDKLCVSLNTATSKSYEKIRAGHEWCDLDGNKNVGDRFNVVCNKIKYWFGLHSHVTTRFEYYISSETKNDVKNFVNMWLPLLGKQDEILTKNILSYGGIIKDPNLLKAPCRMWDNNYLVVAHNGDISPCFLDVNMAFKIGNIKEKTLLEIQNSKERETIKQKSLKKEIMPCKNCNDASHNIGTKIYRYGDKYL